MRHALKGLGFQPCVRTLAGYASECAQVEERRFERRADHADRRRVRARGSYSLAVEKRPSTGWFWSDQMEDAHRG
jgi:hypothetical protein